jgi:hypothetical protein
MPRPTSRARLEYGVKLNINRLMQCGAIQPGSHIVCGTTWPHTYNGKLTARFEAKISGRKEGWFRIKIAEIDLDQRINLVSCPRHFGGRQWYFSCPFMNLRVSVLWMPPGARYFACRQRWGRSVAYLSQCLGREDRADRGKTKINTRLCSIGGFDPYDWDYPPKPKWMRWRTYNKLVEKFDCYEEVAEAGSWARLLKILKAGE